MLARANLFGADCSVAALSHADRAEDALAGDVVVDHNALSTNILIFEQR